MKVVFVCTGNMCRSPMLKFMFEGYLAKVGAQDIEVDSAGTMRHEKPMSAYAKSVLDMRGVAHGEHLSKFCDEKVLGNTDFVFTMTGEHASILRDLYGDRYNIIPLADIIGWDVPDPYNKGLKAYIETYDILFDALPKIYKYITK
ncbi:MAG: low molecular weight phosphatase family protein [Clostridia bacterium]|nr:low molecular weight phosphatase family protein [Clostridia bacterium]